MIGPLQTYKFSGKPLGIWVGILVLVLEFFGQIFSIVMGNIPAKALFFVLPLFLASIFFIMRKSFFGLLSGISFLIIGAYTPLVNQGGVHIFVLLVWWLASAIGILSLLINRRWYNENLPTFP